MKKNSHPSAGQQANFQKLIQASDSLLEDCPAELRVKGRLNIERVLTCTGGYVQVSGREPFVQLFTDGTYEVCLKSNTSRRHDRLSLALGVAYRTLYYHPEVMYIFNLAGQNPGFTLEESREMQNMARVFAMNLLLGRDRFRETIAIHGALNSVNIFDVSYSIIGLWYKTLDFYDPV
jgi:hypothetical protein